uniref:Transcriptional regulator PadR family protein n=1 Tax=Methanococcus maripaludis (strain C6 / ATCC BAA-1332) TaxID=444158 RepID=A9A7I1_METM6
MVLKTLTKKHVQNILELLGDGEERYLSEIQNELEVDTGNLSNLLNKLVKEHLVEKRREPLGEAMGKTYYKISEFGMEALDFYKLDEEFERNKNKIINQTNIKGNVKNVVNMGDNATVNLK